jgi:hypothetical protein
LTEKTPHQNGVVEMNKRTVQEMDRKMLNEDKLLDTFWREAVNKTFYILKRAQIRVNKKKHLMNYGKVDQLLSNTSNYLGESVI